MIVGDVTLALIGAIGWFQLQTDRPRSILAEANIGADTRHGDGHFIGWILGPLGLTAPVGFPIGAALFVLLFTTVKVGGPWWRNALLAAGCIAARLLLADLLTLVHPGGVLQRLFDMPWWFA